MKWKNKGHEFDSVASKICNRNCEYIIWGAGTFGEAFYNDFCSEIKIIAFVDSDLNKQNKEKCGCPVLSPNVLKCEKEIIVLVSTGWTDEVFSRLEEFGYTRWESFFHIDEFMTIYWMYTKNKLCVSNLNINITEFCSLKCRNCSALNPYIKDKKNYSKKEIKYILDLYFKWVDNVCILGLLGGDAMIHPQFNEILELVGETYYKNKKVNNLEVYSNAVITPNEYSIKLFQKFNVIYRFTDYGEYTNGKQKCREIVDLLEKYNIRYDWAKFKHWADCGYPQESNGLIGHKELEAFYNACDRRSCQGLLGTKLFYCGMAIGADRTQYCKAEEGDYFDLNGNVNKRELMEFMLGFNERGYIEYCKKCNGGPNINKHLIKPGIQLKK